MRKYKLVHVKKQDTEHLCDKVTIDGFNYYVNDEKPLPCIPMNICMAHITKLCDKCGKYQGKKVIATNNPNIDIPKVVNEIERLTFQEFKDWSFGEHGPWHTYKMFQKGYSKSQETHPNSDEDTIEFGQWVSHNDWVYLPSKKYWVNEEQEELEQKLSSKELLQLWKEQRIKTIYYE